MPTQPDTTEPEDAAKGALPAPQIEARAYLAAIIDSSDDVIISKSLDGIIQSWNRAARRIFGYSEEEAIGQHISLIIPPDRMDEEYVILGKVRQGERVDHFETVRRAKDGRLVDISLTVSPIRDTNGTVVGVSKVARDITTTKHSHSNAAHLAAIINSSDDAIISKNLDGVITSWNQAAQSIFGYTAAEIVGTHITVLIPPDKLSEESDIIASIKAGKRIEHFETVRRHKTGALVDVSITVSPVLDEIGRIVGASKIARNIGERKRTEQLLADANHRRDEFLANMSHELRTPMNAIMGLAHILSRSEVLRPKEQHMVSMLQTSAEGLLTLINDLLDISKIDQGFIELEHEPFDLQEVAGSTVNLLKAKAAEKQIDIVLSYDDHVGQDFVGDPLRIQQILNNLIGNAVKFTDHGFIRLNVTLSGADGERPLVVLEVSDSGIGIAPEKIEVIFDKFIQADLTMTRKYGGSGLGLSITKALVKRMDGTIEVLSTPGAGSTFIVKLPLQRGKASRARRQAVRERNRQNILIVDDYEPNLIVVSNLVEDMGFTYDMARTGVEALRKATYTAYDAILMDLQMPGMDGFECAKRIRALEAERGYAPAPIIALTAHVRSEDRARCLEVGMNDFIAKPFSPAKLEALVSKFIPSDR